MVNSQTPHPMYVLAVAAGGLAMYLKRPVSVTHRRRNGRDMYEQHFFVCIKKYSEVVRDPSRPYIYLHP